MFGRGRGRSEQDDTDDVFEHPEENAGPLRGPFDDGEAPDDGIERLDLGSVRIPVPEGGQLQVEVDPAGPVRAVHLVTEVGRLTVSAFAAPRSSGLWDEVSDELAEQLRKDGARVHTERGEWGLELVADSPKAALRFVGVDGPRWLLRGVAAGPGPSAMDCARLLYSVLADTVVVRGGDPLPVRTPLPIELPESILRHIQQIQEQQQNPQQHPPGQNPPGQPPQGQPRYGQQPQGQFPPGPPQGQFPQGPPVQGRPPQGRYPSAPNPQTQFNSQP